MQHTEDLASRATVVADTRAAVVTVNGVHGAGGPIEARVWGTWISDAPLHC